MENLKGILQAVEKALCIRAKQLASITGKIISMDLAVGPVARLRTRNMYCLLKPDSHGKICSKLRRM